MTSSVCVGETGAGVMTVMLNRSKTDLLAFFQASVAVVLSMVKGSVQNFRWDKISLHDFVVNASVVRLQLS